MTINITLMVVLIVLLAQEHQFAALTIGAIAFGISVFGISFYVFLTIKEIQLNRRQANFVDSVTHELKTPIASLKLYLETLQMRKLDEAHRAEFYGTMETELKRLDGLINQLLKVGRLDAIGHESPPEEIPLRTSFEAVLSQRVLITARRWMMSFSSIATRSHFALERCCSR